MKMENATLVWHAEVSGGGDGGVWRGDGRVGGDSGVCGVVVEELWGCGK